VYSPEAKANHVQGTVVLQLVVNEKGKPTELSVISPLGFGLDEQAKAAVAKWEFEPATKSGKPLRVLVVVEANFSLVGDRFDQKTEGQRTEFNKALQTLKRPEASAGAVEQAVHSLMDLANHNYAPAMFVVGMWEINGEHGSKNLSEGLELIQKAASKDYAGALYEVAGRHIDGRDLPRDLDTGLREMRKAAKLGNRQAQFYLGSTYEAGTIVPRDLENARAYFQLCAAQDVAQCQYRLGRLLFDAPDRRERDYLQAIALFQLAAAQDVAEAKQLYISENARLTADQSAWVAKMKQKIVQK
jgi:TonB family protein